MPYALLCLLSRTVKVVKYSCSYLIRILVLIQVPKPATLPVTTGYEAQVREKRRATTIL